MLNIQHNRLNYGKLLAAPAGFELTKAIGTTYSLDLFALLAIPVSLFYSKDMEGDFSLNRYDVLDAIRRSKEKVDLFCQRGKILVSKDYNSLLAFMEDCVEEVQPSIINASFHPKIWILRFEKKGEIIYRLIVLSRNLTFDRSWDIAYFSDGVVSGKKVPSSKKLSSFIKDLYTNSTRKINNSLLEELSRVEFDLPHNFSDFEMFPIHPKTKPNAEFFNPVEDFKYKELLVISPFVNKEAIATIKQNSKKITLLSRQEELDKLDPELLDDLEVYCMNHLVSNGEDYTDTEGHEPKSQNLHAKIYIGENNRVADWYMGSANCTSPAFDRNTEMLVKMSTTNYNFRLAKTKQVLFEEGPQYFIPYERKEIEVDEEKENVAKQIRDLTHFLCGLKFLGSITSSEENENHILSVEVDLFTIQAGSVTVKACIPHKQDNKEDLILGQRNCIEFSNIAITNLSKYLVLTFYHEDEYQKGILVKLKLDIPDEREDQIFKHLINSKDKFYQYLQFLLSPQDMRNTLQISPNNLGKGEDSTHLQNLFGANNPIYEALMIAASRDPKKLQEIDKVVTKLEQIDKEVVKDFMPIWTVFKEFAND
jgi:HKD family nuclease